MGDEMFEDGRCGGGAGVASRGGRRIGGRLVGVTSLFARVEK
jgi:hypothetical protein